LRILRVVTQPDGVEAVHLAGQGDLQGGACVEELEG
jgi:hypothetical protein